MIKRRTLLAMLGVTAAASVARANSHIVMTSELERTRDVLLPGLYAAVGQHEGLQADITISRSTKCLVVSVWQEHDPHKVLGFVVTERAITDRLYRTTFKPCMEKCCELVMGLA